MSTEKRLIHGVIWLLLCSYPRKLGEPKFQDFGMNLPTVHTRWMCFVITYLIALSLKRFQLSYQRSGTSLCDFLVKATKKIIYEDDFHWKQSKPIHRSFLCSLYRQEWFMMFQLDFKHSCNTSIQVFRFDLTIKFLHSDWNSDKFKLKTI